jgi:hypothetical protein
VLLGCGGLLLLVLLVIATTAGTIWWLQRPIQPVVLSETEKSQLADKIARVEGGQFPHTLDLRLTGNRDAQDARTNPAKPQPTPAGESDRPYEPGAKILRLSEREINGLLNMNTDLGETLRFEFGRDAINAYAAIPIPEDFPIAAGAVVKLRGRFRVSIGNGGEPVAVLEDLTVFGLSLPKDWLGGIKGENLLKDAIAGPDAPFLTGVKRIAVEPGYLVIEVND